MDKENVVYTHTHTHTHTHTAGCYSVMIKNAVMPFTAAWMDLEISILSEVSKRKVNTMMLPLICGI